MVGHAGKILALEEGHFPYVLDATSTPSARTDFGGVLTGSFTAHPKICPVTGELLAFGYGPLPPYLRYLRVSTDGPLVQSEEITVGGPTMMHDFNVTRNHVIFMDLPVVFDLEAAMRGEMPIHWDDDYPARLGVMPRDRRRRRRAVVRDRPLLRVPPDERVRGRRHDRPRRRSPQPHLAGLDDGLPAARSSGAGRSTPSPAPCGRSRSTTGPASSRVSPTASSACPTATAT